MTDRISRLKPYLLALLLAAATIVAYQPAWHGGFIWDDDDYITKNSLLTAADGWQRIWFSLDAPSQYFPLVYSTFRVERSLWGLNPTGYHWVNLLLHIATALLVWRLLQRLKIPGAWLAAMIFALHPVNVESVAWITERKNVLMGVFFLLSLLGWHNFSGSSGKGRWSFYVLSLLAYTVALTAKTTACTLPAALFLILWLRRKPITRGRILQIVPFIILGLGMGLITIWWERFHQGTHGDLFALGPLERLLVATRAVWFYLAKLFWPAKLTFIYPQWKIDPANPLAYLGLLGVLGLGLAVVWARRFCGRSLEVALLFYLATLGPMLGFIMLYTFRYTYVADHYQYLASIGPIALVSAGVVRLTLRFSRSSLLLPAISLVLVAALGTLTWRQSRDYRDIETLWISTLAKNPQCWMAHSNLGILFLARGQPDAAIARYEKALQLQPAAGEVHYNLANALLEKGQVDDAIAHGRTALALRPQNSDTHVAYGNALLAKGSLDGALDEYVKAVELRPQNADAHYNLANALEQKGETAQASAHYEEALRISPDLLEAHLNLGNMLMRRGREPEALAHFERALAGSPDSPKAQNNLAWAYSSAADRSLRQGEKAVGLAESANRLTGRSDSIVLHTLAAAYAEAGQFEMAIRAAETSLALARTRGEADLARELEREIGLYRQGSAYHR